MVATAAIGAGLIHAAAIGAHAEQVGLARMFLLAAVLGVTLGVMCVATPARWVLAAAAGVHAAFLLTWVLTRTAGLPGIDGLQEPEVVGFADAVAAGLALVVVVGCVVLLASRPSLTAVSRPVGVVASLLLVALFVPALADASTHGHGDDHSQDASDEAAHAHEDGAAHEDGTAHDEAAHEGTEAAGHDEGNESDHEHAAADAKPFDPTAPIDLSGTPGVTQVQQKEAELLLANTLEMLPRYADPAVAEAAGYKSIGDSSTGDEHFINWSLLDDEHVLDPAHPESLVYGTRNGERSLEAAMFIMPEGYSLENVPPIGGSLIQWHIHNNLCFTPWPSLQVAGVTSENGPCPADRVNFPARPMIHVWIASNPCGPFAALEGVGAGQVKEGETRACDHAHGSSTF
ncbi:MAG TPA: hypothetical protein VJM33_17425 [Microthrixaceae bacterium]|nr:hypothetical protein [Microthrixaceae bacterium]